MEMVKVPATLDDGRKIALLLPAEHKDTVLATLMKHVHEQVQSMPQALAMPKQTVRPADQPRPRRRTEAGMQAARAICQKCPTQKFTTDPNGWWVCTACNCPLDHKILVANAKCPDGHWDAEKEK